MNFDFDFEINIRLPDIIIALGLGLFFGIALGVLENYSLKNIGFLAAAFLGGLATFIVIAYIRTHNRKKKENL